MLVLLLSKYRQCLIFMNRKHGHDLFPFSFSFICIFLVQLRSGTASTQSSSLLPVSSPPFVWTWWTVWIFLIGAKFAVRSLQSLAVWSPAGLSVSVCCTKAHRTSQSGHADTASPTTAPSTPLQRFPLIVIRVQPDYSFLATYICIFRPTFMCWRVSFSLPGSVKHARRYFSGERSVRALSLTEHYGLRRHIKGPFEKSCLCVCCFEREAWPCFCVNSAH